MKKTVLITGTSRGIGKATAFHFQNKGWNVVATMRAPEKETEPTRLDNALVEKLDVLDLGSINQAVQKGIKTLGRLMSCETLQGMEPTGHWSPFQGQGTPMLMIQNWTD